MNPSQLNLGPVVILVVPSPNNVDITAHLAITGCRAKYTGTGTWKGEWPVREECDTEHPLVGSGVYIGRTPFPPRIAILHGRLTIRRVHLPEGPFEPCPPTEDNWGGQISFQSGRIDGSLFYLEDVKGIYGQKGAVPEYYRVTGEYKVTRNQEGTYVAEVSNLRVC